MAVQMHHSLVVSLVDRQEAVPHDNSLLLTSDAHLDPLGRHDLLKQFLEYFSFGIVIAADQMYFAVQTVYDLPRVRGVGAAEHIADDEDMILRPDFVIPAPDHLLLHFVQIAEGTAVKMDDISVSEVQIRDEVNFSHMTVPLLSVFLRPKAIYFAQKLLTGISRRSPAWISSRCAEGSRAPPHRRWA